MQYILGQYKTNATFMAVQTLFLYFLANIWFSKLSVLLTPIINLYINQFECLLELWESCPIRLGGGAGAMQFADSS